MLNRVTYLVTAENKPDLLARVVMLMHRLAVPIDRLTIKRSAKSRTLALTLEAEVVAGQAERVAENLMKLVPVLSVEIGRLRTRHRSRSPQTRPGTAR